VIWAGGWLRAMPASRKAQREGEAAGNKDRAGGVLLSMSSGTCGRGVVLTDITRGVSAIEGDVGRPFP
jgi:hypothetical protein